MRSDAPVRCHLLLISFDQADAAHGYRGPAFVVRMSCQDVQLTGLDRADYSRNAGSFARPKRRSSLMWRFIMPRIPVVVIALSLAALGGIAVAAQDKYTLQLPGGLPFSDFRGYEDWQVVSVSQTDELLKVMVANPVMIDAYKAGVPGNGQPFPDGSKIAKIEWKPKKMTESPFAVNVPSTLQDVFLIEKDTKRFPNTKGWAYAVFDYNPASDTFTPDASGTVNCGFACHTVVASKDYIFHSYQKR
jgi:hypothetical protein